MVPNNVVLAAAVVPLREPDSVDVKVTLSSGIRPSQVQAILDANVSTPTRKAPSVLLEEIDGDSVVVRVQATPERPATARGSPTRSSLRWSGHRRASCCLGLWERSRGRVPSAAQTPMRTQPAA